MALSHDLSPKDALPVLPGRHMCQVSESVDPRCIHQLKDLGPQGLDIRVKRPIQLDWYTTVEGYHVQALALGGAYTGQGPTPEEAILKLQQVIVGDIRMFKDEHARGKVPTDIGRECAGRLNRFVEIFYS
jgi:hypothetical protein